MKRYPSGFEPADFQSVGKALWIIGVCFILIKLVDLFIVDFNLPNIVLYTGIAMIFVGAYLVYVVPKKE